MARPTGDLDIPGLPPFRHRDDLHCKTVDPNLDLWYDGNTDAARALCKNCPAKRECLLWAIEHEPTYGIYGGRSAAERRHDAAAIGRRRTAATATLTAPQRPQRLATAWGWVQAKLVDRDALTRTFTAAHDYIDNGGTVRQAAERHRINQTRLCDAVLIVRRAPYLEADVLDGWVQFGTAYAHAREVRDYHGQLAAARARAA